MAVMRLQLLKRWGGYSAGELVSFQPNLARHMIQHGIACVANTNETEPEPVAVKTKKRKK